MLSFVNNFYSCADIKSSSVSELDFNFITLYVQEYNEIASYAVFGKSEKLLPSTIKVLSKSLLNLVFLADHGEGTHELNSTFTIPLVRELFSSATFKLIEKDLKGKGYVAEEQFLRSLVKIRDYNYLDVMFDALQSPDIEERVECIKDTYTCSFKPTMNYGDYGSLLCGPSLQGDNLSYVYIPLERIYQIINLGMDVVELDLLIESAMTHELEVKFNVILTEWDESSLTWRQVIRKSDINFSGRFENGKLRVSLTELIHVLHEREYKGLNLQIECNQELAMFSKESGHGPAIRIVWRDPEWSGFVGNLGLRSTAILKAFDNRDLGSVVQFLDKLTLDCTTIFEKLRSNIESVAHIKGFEVSKLSGKGKFVPKSNDLESIVVLRTQDKEDFIGTAHIPCSQVISSFWLRMQKALQSDVFIRSDSFDDYIGYALIVANAISGLANIVRELSLQGIAKIIGNTYTDFSSTANLSTIKLDMDSIVKFASNSFDTNLSSVASITGSYLYASASILQDTTLTSTADINPLLENTLTSTIWISPSNNESTEIKSKAEVKIPTKGFYGSAYINGCKAEDFKSVVEFSKLKSNVISEVIFKLTDKNNFHSSATVRLLDKKDLKGKTDVYQVSDIKSYAQYQYANNMYSEAIVRQRDIKELDSTSLLSTDSLVTFLNGHTILRSRNRIHLVCSANIRSSARRWVPNVHASHIFNYGRKLPRQYGN